MAQPASIPRLLASALAAFGLMGRVAGAESELVSRRTRTQICDALQRESGPLHEILSALAQWGRQGTDKGPQIFIAQDLLGTAGAQACLAALCAMGNEDQQASFWVVAPHEFSTAAIRKVATLGREMELSMMAGMAGTSRADPTPPHEDERVFSLDEFLNLPGTDSSFFFFEPGTPGPSNVLEDAQPGVVSLHLEHAYAPLPGTGPHRARPPRDSLWYQAVLARPVIMLYTTGLEQMQTTYDKAIAGGLPVVIVALDEQHNVTLLPPFTSWETLQTLAGDLGPDMTLLGHPARRVARENAATEMGTNANVGTGATSGTTTGAATVTGLSAATSPQAVALFLGGALVFLFRKSILTRLLGPGQGAPAALAPQDKARHRKDKPAAKTLPAQGAETPSAAGEPPPQFNPLPPAARKPPVERDPKRIADAVVADLRSADKESRKKLLGKELGPRIAAAMTAPDHTFRVDAAGILLGLAAAARDEAALKLLFADLKISHDFRQILQAVASASAAHPFDSELQRAADLLEQAAPGFNRALQADVDDTRYGGRQGPADWSLKREVAGTEEKKRPPLAAALPGRVRLNLGTVYQFARALASQAPDGGQPYGEFDTGKVTIPRADRDPHIHIETGLIAFRKGRDDNWQLTDGDFLLVRHVQAALASLGPHPERNSYNVPIVTFLLHLLSLANEMSAGD